MTEKLFYTKEDVMELLGFGDKKSLAIIRELNKELKAKGFRYERGRINVKFFNDRYGVN